MSNNLNINWSEVIKKEARGVSDYDLGEVQEISEDFVITEKGLMDKEKYIIPKSLVLNYDGNKIYFNVVEQESTKYKQL